MKSLGTYTPENIGGYFDHESGIFEPHGSDADEGFPCDKSDFVPYSGPLYSAFDDAEAEW